MPQETQRKKWKIVKSHMGEINFRAPLYVTGHNFLTQTQVFWSSGICSKHLWQWALVRFECHLSGSSPTICTVLNMIVWLEQKTSPSYSVHQISGSKIRYKKNMKIGATDTSRHTRGIKRLTPHRKCSVTKRKTYAIISPCEKQGIVEA